ncbi:hypothetical protein ACFWIA_20785, partial [Streptomyces sp. NPDC127068]
MDFNSVAEPDGSAVVRVLSYNVRSMRDDTAAGGGGLPGPAPPRVRRHEGPPVVTRGNKRAQADIKKIR